MRSSLEGRWWIDDAELGRGDPEPGVSVAMRRSQSMAKAHPPPMQSPVMNAIVGFGSSAKAVSATRFTSAERTLVQPGGQPPTR